MSNIQLYKKPELIILESEDKLRVLVPEERLIVCKKLITALIEDLGISNKGDKSSNHIRAIKFLTLNAEDLTIGEIEKSFNLFISGDLGLEVYQQVNAKVIGDILKNFRRYKSEKLKIYRQNMQNLKDQENKPSQEEQEKGNDASIEKMFTKYKKDRAIPDGYSYLYGVLFKRGKLPKHTPTYKAKIKAKAVNFAIAEKEFLASEDMELKRALPSALRRIESGESTRVKVLSKSIVLAEYCERRILGL